MFALLRQFARHRALIVRALALATAFVVLLLLNGGRTTSPLVIAAGNDDPRPIGFIEQATGRYLYVQLDPQEPDYGRFRAGLPGVGYLVSTGVAQVTVTSPTATHLQFSGSGGSMPPRSWIRSMSSGRGHPDNPRRPPSNWWPTSIP